MSRAEKLKEGQKLVFSVPPDFTGAKACFEAVISSAPNWIEGHLWLASTLELLHENPGAIKAYKDAIRCDNNDPRPKIALGRLLSILGHHREAVAELERGLALKPHYGEADARLFLAEAFQKAKNLTKAVEQWRIVRDMEPAYPSYEHPRQEAERRLHEYAKDDR